MLKSLAPETAEARVEEFRASWVSDSATEIWSLWLTCESVQVYLSWTLGQVWLHLPVLGFGFLVGALSQSGRLSNSRILAWLFLGLFAATAVASLIVVGPLGPTGPLLWALPVTAATLIAPQAGWFFALVTAALYLAVALLHIRGWLTGPQVFGGDHPELWWATIAGSTAMTLGVVFLLGRVLRDLERVTSEFESAQRGLLHARKLRSAAEGARDEALAIRHEMRSVEALGVVAGSVVHDLNNMAQVIRTWAQELKLRDGEPSQRTHRSAACVLEQTHHTADFQATEGSLPLETEEESLQLEAPLESLPRKSRSSAAHAIADACDRLTQLSREVLALGSGTSEQQHCTALEQCLPVAIRSLGRFLRENVRIELAPFQAEVHEVLSSCPTLPICEQDSMYLLLETVAQMNLPAVDSGRLIVSFQRSVSEEVPPGMWRLPLELQLQFENDEPEPITKRWTRRVEEVRELMSTSEIRVFLHLPEPRLARLVFDLYPQLSEVPESSPLSLPTFSFDSRRRK